MMPNSPAFRHLKNPLQRWKRHWVSGTPSTFTFWMVERATPCMSILLAAERDTSWMSNCPYCWWKGIHPGRPYCWLYKYCPYWWRWKGIHLVCPYYWWWKGIPYNLVVERDTPWTSPLVDSCSKMLEKSYVNAGNRNAGKKLIWHRHFFR
jgi:hypothetical protein